jgi:hypothetical protein
MLERHLGDKAIHYGFTKRNDGYDVDAFGPAGELSTPCCEEIGDYNQQVGRALGAAPSHRQSEAASNLSVDPENDWRVQTRAQKNRKTDLYSQDIRTGDGRVKDNFHVNPGDIRI